MNEIFYEFREVRLNGLEKSSIEIIFHFLAKIESSLILYETKQNMSKSDNTENDIQVSEMFEKSFKQVDPTIVLVKGKIREIFLSYS